MQRRRERIAKPLLDAQLLKHVGPETSNDALLGHIVAEALLKRIDRNLVESKNIYLETFDIPQIELFSSLGSAVPLVPASHSIANQYLVGELRERTTGSLLEIGVGRAVQLVAFLKMLAQNHGALRTLKVLALDPDKNNIAATVAAVEALRPSLPFELVLETREGLLENISDEALRTWVEFLGPEPTVNSSFTLHHVMHPMNDTEFRTRLLRRINEYFKPSVFTLIEPHADHDTEGVGRRFDASWRHFGTVFEMVDRSSVAPEHRFVIKEKFFGREIRDIFGTSDMFRCERHETYDQWLFRLAKAGFVAAPAKSPVRIELPDYCSAKAADGIVRIGYDDVPVVAIMASRTK